MDAEPNDPARKLIHDDQGPVGPQRGRFTPEQIHAPEAVFYVAPENQPGRSTGVLFRRSDGRESFEPRLCRFRCGMPR
jgi:hypothetical protein